MPLGMGTHQKCSSPPSEYIAPGEMKKGGATLVIIRLAPAFFEFALSKYRSPCWRKW